MDFLQETSDQLRNTKTKDIFIKDSQFGEFDQELWNSFLSNFTIKDSIIFFGTSSVLDSKL